MIKELQKIMESAALAEKKFDFKGYIKGLDLKDSDAKKLMTSLDKNKDGVESAEDVFRAATDLKIDLSENLNEGKINADTVESIAAFAEGLKTLVRLGTDTTDKSYANTKKQLTALVKKL